MKDLKSIAACALIVLGAFGSFAQPVKMATGDWAPFTGEKLPSQGVCVAVVRAACKAGGLTEDTKFYPWVRCEAMVKSGEAFATFPYQMTDERRAKYAGSEPIIVAKSKIFYCSGVGKDIQWTSLKDFQKYRMGDVNGYWYTEAFTQNGIKADLANGSDLAFKMLQSGRFDYLIENELVGLETIKTLFPGETDKFKTLEKPYDESPFVLMVSRTYPNSEEILKKFNAGLAAIRQDGTYQDILKKSGISN